MIKLMKKLDQDESEISQNGSFGNDDYPTIKSVALFNSNVTKNINIS